MVCTSSVIFAERTLRAFSASEHDCAMSAFLQFHMKCVSNQKISGNEVYYTMLKIPLVNIMLCSKLHCQKPVKSIHISYKTQAHTSLSLGILGGAGVRSCFCTGKMMKPQGLSSRKHPTIRQRSLGRSQRNREVPGWSTSRRNGRASHPLSDRLRLVNLFAWIDSCGSLPLDRREAGPPKLLNDKVGSDQ